MSRFPEFTPLVFESDSPALLLAVLLTAACIAIVPSRLLARFSQWVPGTLVTLAVCAAAIYAVHFNWHYAADLQANAPLVLHRHHDNTLYARAVSSNSDTIRTRAADYLYLRRLVEGERVAFHPDAGINLTRLVHYAGATTAVSSTTPLEAHIWLPVLPEIP